MNVLPYEISLRKQKSLTKQKILNKTNEKKSLANLIKQYIKRIVHVDQMWLVPRMQKWVDEA